MNITTENTEDLKVIIKININESDYIDNYEKSLKAYQRKTAIHGFRPGKVPMTYILNSHGRSIKYEEISKLSSEAFEKYLAENNFDYLFSPTLLPEGLDDEHWIEQKDFVFTYEVILKPKIDFDIENLEVDYYNVIPPQMLIDSMVKNARSERGDIIDQEAIIEDCSFNCNFEELDIEGNVNEDGNKNNSSIKLEDIKDVDTINKLIGLKTNDTIVINPFVAFDNANSTARFLKTDTTDEALKSNYKLIINEIQTIKLAEFTPELYKSIYPNDDIQTEEEFLERVKIEGSTYYTQHTDPLFYGDAMTSILQSDKYNLPDDLIKQAFIDYNHGNITAEMLEKDYKKYRGSIVYISFEKYIKDKYNFNITYEDVKAYMKSRFLSQFGNMQDLDNQLLTAIDKYADDQLKDKKQYKEAREDVFELLLIKLLKETIKINYKSVTFDEFIAKLKATHHTHEHEHQHDHEHDHDHEHEHNHDHNHDHDHKHHHDHDHGHDHNHNHGDHHHHSH